MLTQHQKDIQGILGAFWLLSCIINIVVLIICRRGCQKYLDPIYKNTGSIAFFYRNNSAAILIRTILYMGAAFTERGRKKHFEGKDPRIHMPKSLRRWIRVYWYNAAIFVLIGFISIAIDLLDPSKTLREIFLN